MKKICAIVLAMCLCAGLLAACANAEEPVELRIMWWGSQTRHDRTIAVLEMYMEQNPNVTFSYEFMGSQDYWTKLGTLVASGDVPDVFQIGNNFLTFESAIEPLDSYIESGLIDVSGTNDSYLSTTRIKGVQMGMSLGVNSLAMAYDPAMFEQAGVAEPTENWTWADFEEAALTIHEKLGVFGSSMLNDFFIGMVIGIPQYGTGETIYNEDGTGLGYTDDSHVANFFAMKKRLTDAGAYPTVGEVATILDMENDFLTTGTAAMGWLHSNTAVAMMTAANRPLKLAPPPKQTADGPSGLCIRSSQAFSIYNGSKNKEEAAKFINWFLNDIEANKILGGERGVPIMAQVRESLTENLDEVTAMTYDFIDLVGEIASNPPPLEPAAQTELEDIRKTIDEEVMFGLITPEEAAARFREEANEAFARHAE